MVLGMGGGCDVFMAYTLAKQLQNSADTGAKILYANCISERKDGIPAYHQTLVPGSLYAVPKNLRQPAENKGVNTYGTTFLEQTVPRGDEGSPLLVEVKGNGGVKTSADVRTLIDENYKRIKRAFDYLEIDLVFGVDCGGDSLTGGKDFVVDIRTGRDQQVLRAFRKYSKHHPDFTFIHLVLGPGCDAESSEDVMRKEVWMEPTIDDPQRNWCAGRMYLGCFSMEKMIEECFPLVEHLEKNRTPFLMYRAMKNNDVHFLPRPKKEEESYHTFRDLVKIERHNNFEVIPRNWLTHGLVFKYDRKCFA